MKMLPIKGDYVFAFDRFPNFSNCCIAVQLQHSILHLAIFLLFLFHNFDCRLSCLKGLSLMTHWRHFVHLTDSNFKQEHPSHHQGHYGLLIIPRLPHSLDRPSHHHLLPSFANLELLQGYLMKKAHLDVASS